MIIRLDTARHEQVTWEEIVELSPVELRIPQVADLSPIAVHGEVGFVSPDFELQLDLRFELSMVCDRCAQMAVEKIESRNHLMISVRSKKGRAEPEPEVALRQDELGWLELTAEEFDSLPLVAEQVQLEVPARPLCREDCAGLCPGCGADLNVEACSCERNGAGSPLGAALLELKKRMNESA